MSLALSISSRLAKGDTVVVLSESQSHWNKADLPKSIKDQFKREINIEEGQTMAVGFADDRWYVGVGIKDIDDSSKYKETARKAGYTVCKLLNKNKVKAAHISASDKAADAMLPFAEGIAMSNYQFLKYKTKESKANTLQSLKLDKAAGSKTEVEHLQAAIDGNKLARDLVNEPLSFLTAAQLAKEAERAGKEVGIKTEIMGMAKIKSLKMGGLLAVNRGGFQPPTFTIMEYKPKNAKNKKPYILVGKGVVYDTGGVSLKPTANSMDMMKCDMGGAAAVIGSIYAIAKAKLPIHVITLVPATENRPGKDAYVPGDVIKMHSGLNVEVLNTDAEGRMILADALSYAKRYKPELVFDFATLTGAAARAIGPLACCFMGNADDDTKQKLSDAGYETYERVVEFPFWEEYGELIKSDVADIKNLGGAFGGMITAGKFLEHFTDYPWMHFDIAGPAYLMQEDNYRGKYGTGYGVRLMFEYFSKLA